MDSKQEKKEYIQIVYGIKVSDDKFKELHEDFMKARDKNNGYDEDSKIFWLHEKVYGLDGYWIGDIDNPNGLIIGCAIEVFDSYEELDLERLQSNLNAINDEYEPEDFSDYERWANEFLGIENEKFKLHIFIEKI